MKIEFNYYKNSGKWYDSNIVEVGDFDDIQRVGDNLYHSMSYTTHIIEEDGYKQPYRLYLR